jgi:hypothetical protein
MGIVFREEDGSEWSIRADESLFAWRFDECIYGGSAARIGLYGGSSNQIMLDIVTDGRLFTKGIKLEIDPDENDPGTIYLGGNDKDSIVVRSNDSLVVEGPGYLLQTDRLAMTPTTHEFTTEGDLPDPLIGTILLDGDDDTDNDVLHLQDGTTAGQIVYIIAAADIDSDDTVTIDTSTDTTGDNVPAIEFNKTGENATLMWTGTAWVCLGLEDSL